jgi:hypothetical protein
LQRQTNYTIGLSVLAFVNLISEKHTKHLIKSLWVLLSLLIKFKFGIEPPKELSAATAQIDPEDLPNAPVSILLPPAAFLPMCAPTINVAQATIEVSFRLKRYMSLAKKQKLMNS